MTPDLSAVAMRQARVMGEMAERLRPQIDAVRRMEAELASPAVRAVAQGLPASQQLAETAKKISEMMTPQTEALAESIRRRSQLEELSFTSDVLKSMTPQVTAAAALSAEAARVGEKLAELGTVVRAQHLLAESLPIPVELSFDQQLVEAVQLDQGTQNAIYRIAEQLRLVMPPGVWRDLEDVAQAQIVDDSGIDSVTSAGIAPMVLLLALLCLASLTSPSAADAMAAASIASARGSAATLSLTDDFVDLIPGIDTAGLVALLLQLVALIRRDAQ